MSQGPHSPVTALWSHFRWTGQHPPGSTLPKLVGDPCAWWVTHTLLLIHGVSPFWVWFMPCHLRVTRLHMLCTPTTPEGSAGDPVHPHPPAFSMALEPSGQMGCALTVLCSAWGQSRSPWVCLWGLCLIPTCGDLAPRF